MEIDSKRSDILQVSTTSSKCMKILPTTGKSELQKVY